MMKLISYVKSFTSYVKFHLKIVVDLYKWFKFKTVLLFVVSIMLTLIDILNLKLLKYLTNRVANYSFDDNTFNTILVTVSCFAIALFILYLISWLFDYIFNVYSKDITEKINTKWVKKLSKISYENFESSKFYDKMWISKKAAQEYSSAMSLVVTLLNILIYTIVYSIWLCQINVVFLFFIIVALVINISLSKKAIFKWDNYYDKYLIPEQRKSIYFEGILSNRVNHHSIQVNRQLNYFIKKYEKHADNERKYTLKQNMLSFFVQFGSSIFFLCTAIATMIYVAKNIVVGVFDIGQFTLISAMLFKLFGIQRQLTYYLFMQKKHVKVISTYKDIMAIEDEKIIDDKNHGNKLVMNNVFYKYKQAQKYALKDLSLEFKNGEVIAVVGENGSGKTTLISIILGLLKKSSGEYLNTIGKPIAIMQDFQSYKLTIKQNVELGRGGKTMSDTEVTNILKQVQLYDVVKNLPHGINTKIGQLENGIELSKGQMQRLALARLLANNTSKIWILDEPTAYLDPIAEIDMYNYILSLAKGKLVFFISHRLGFARKADKIILIDNGTVLETGTHDDLIRNKNSKYYKMYQSQKEWYA